MGSIGYLGNAILAILFAFLPGVLGGAVTAKNIPTWYAGIRKPSWNPPNRVFGPVWSLLYLCMGIASWIVWSRAGFHGAWLPLYLLQWALNLLWSYLFFGWRQPGWAFLEIIGMWIAILATSVAFWNIAPVAGWLFLPYLAWVSFAACLNGTVWRLNRT